MTGLGTDRVRNGQLRILVVSTYFSPDVCGIAPIVGDLCAGLAQRGHAVTVLTSYPHYPEWKNKENCRPWSRRTDVLSDGTQIIRHGVVIPKVASSLIGRLCYELSLLFSLCRSLWMPGQRFSVIYVVCPSIGNVLFARVRACFTGEPVVVCIQDIPALAARTTGLAGRWLGKLAATLQRWIIRPVQTLTTISPIMAECIQQTIEPARPVIVIPNWLVGSMAAAVEQTRAQPPVSGPHTVRSLFYSGNIGNKQGLAEFCRALQQLELPFEMKIHGDGAAAGALHDQLALSNDVRFRHGPLLPAEAFVQQLKQTDWFVITEKTGVGAAVMPSKLIPAVCLGVPILAVCDPAGALGQTVVNHQLGLCLPWTRLDELQERLASISPNCVELYRRNCLAFSRTYDRMDRIIAIEDVLRAACSPVRVVLPTRLAGGVKG